MFPYFALCGPIVGSEAAISQWFLLSRRSELKAANGTSTSESLLASSSAS